MIFFKKCILEHQEGRTTERAKMWIHTVDYPHKLYKSYLIIEIKAITSSDTDNSDI